MMKKSELLFSFVDNPVKVKVGFTVLSIDTINAVDMVSYGTLRAFIFSPA